MFVFGFFAFNLIKSLLKTYCHMVDGDDSGCAAVTTIADVVRHHR